MTFHDDDLFIQLSSISSL